MKNSAEKTREYIRKRYADIAKKPVQVGGCCSTSCCSCGASSLDLHESSHTLGYKDSEVDSVPLHANMGLGCGNPLAQAQLKEGEVVLDLGSGGGFDCFLARTQVGNTGKVIGVDMTPQMIQLSRDNAEKAGYENVEFRLGEIENLPVKDTSIDVIISNCVVNLSLDKKQVFSEAYRVLKQGGRLVLSDIVATAVLPKEVQDDLDLLAGCIAGAEHYKTIERWLKEANFTDIRLQPKDSSKQILDSWNPGSNLEDYVASYIIEAKKA
ncbi:MAG: arsenite methyltransferase [Sphaerochaeta sp.]